MVKDYSDKLTQKLRIEVKAPSLFRCPISLEIMQSPVSLCTGVTYDRASIQRWLDSGKTTCPATMLPLSTTDLVPNLTLRRLINIWSAAKVSKDDYTPADIIRDLNSFKLDDFFMDQDIDDSVKNSLVCAPDFVKNVVHIAFEKKHGIQLNLKAVEILDLILDSDWIDPKSKATVVSALCQEFHPILDSIIGILKDEGSKPDVKGISIRVLNAAISGSGSKIAASDKLDDLICEITKLVNSCIATDEALKCLSQLTHSKHAIKLMLHYDIVHTLLKILSRGTVNPKSAEKAIMILEASASCTAGRTSIDEVVEECVWIVMGWMMKVGKEGREAAVGILWNLCYNNKNNGTDMERKAKEEVARVKGGMGKVLVVMQGDCGGVVRKMAGDLLRVFRADKMSLVAGYDTKTTHIMPF